MEESDERFQKSSFAKLAVASQIGLEMVAPAVFGYFADKYFNTGRVCLVAGVVLGFGYGMFRLVRFARREFQAEERSGRGGA